jgi:hypothetical protein
MILVSKVNSSGKGDREKPLTCKYRASVGNSIGGGYICLGLAEGIRRCDSLRCKPCVRLLASGGFLQQWPVKIL